MLLSTQYRRPIEFTDEVLTAARKGLSVFHRLFERVERLMGPPGLTDETPDLDRLSGALLETEQGHFARAVLALKMKFLEMMDDDFNTAGAIAVLHELAGAVNGLIERHNIEQNKQPELIQAAAGAAQTLKKLGQVLGLFRPELARAAGGAGRDASAQLVEQLMQLMIALRAEARSSKNFALADRIRNGLTEAGVTLEDRPDGTIWRKA
jgi:cysteinyl-tRNA synthetase